MWHEKFPCSVSHDQKWWKAAKKWEKNLNSATTFVIPTSICWKLPFTLHGRENWESLVTNFSSQQLKVIFGNQIQLSWCHQCGKSPRRTRKGPGMIRVYLHRVMDSDLLWSQSSPCLQEHWSAEYYSQLGVKSEPYIRWDSSIRRLGWTIDSSLPFFLVPYPSLVSLDDKYLLGPSPGPQIPSQSLSWITNISPFPLLDPRYLLSPSSEPQIPFCSLFWTLNPPSVSS